MMNVKQLKLITGEEILCDVIDIEINEFDEEIIIIKSACALVSTEDFENQVRFYTFRPFMMHQYESNKVMILQSGAVICSAIPDRKVIDQYETHVEQNKADEEDDIDSSVNDLDDTPDDTNVLKFNPKNKLH